jgi:hypothetical protein
MFVPVHLFVLTWYIETLVFSSIVLLIVHLFVLFDMPCIYKRLNNTALFVFDKQTLPHKQYNLLF